jgi:FMN phosphatase YigB (HAD superfamily)
MAGVSARAIADVGDRVDNDGLPAKTAGRVSVFLRRGPWGLIPARRPEPAQADVWIESLTDLRGALDAPQ